MTSKAHDRDVGWMMSDASVVASFTALSVRLLPGKLERPSTHWMKIVDKMQDMLWRMELVRGLIVLHIGIDCQCKRLWKHELGWHLWKSLLKRIPWQQFLPLKSWWMVCFTGWHSSRLSRRSCGDNCCSYAIFCACTCWPIGVNGIVDLEWWDVDQALC